MKSFSLTELVFVIGILIILIGVVAFGTRGGITSTEDAKRELAIRSLEPAAKQYYARTSTFKNICTTDSSFKKYLKS